MLLHGRRLDSLAEKLKAMRGGYARRLTPFDRIDEKNVIDQVD